jgi:DNA polymerase II small subunit
MIGGLEWLIYHGRSLDEIMMKIPNATYAKPAEAMVELLQRRHLSPIYGSRAGVAPEAEDYLVIDRVPAVIHSGHVHTVGFCRYRGVTLINSGAWQSQTEFQKKVNLQPTPGIVPFIDQETMKIRKLVFC